MMVSRFRTSAPGYCDLTLGGAELEEVKSLRILQTTLDFKLTFESHLREVVSKAARHLWVVRRAGTLFDCPRVYKAVSMHMFCSAWNIVPTCGCRRCSVIWETRATTYFFLNLCV